MQRPAFVDVIVDRPHQMSNTWSSRCVPPQGHLSSYGSISSCGCCKVEWLKLWYWIGLRMFDDLGVPSAEEGGQGSTGALEGTERYPWLQHGSCRMERWSTPPSNGLISCFFSCHCSCESRELSRLSIEKTQPNPNEPQRVPGLASVIILLPSPTPRSSSLHSRGQRPSSL